MRRLVLLFLLAQFILAACGAPRPTDQTPVIIASFSVLSDVTQQIVGSIARVDTLVGPDSDTHAYEPRPVDSARIRSARAVVRIGLGFEPWLDELYTAAESPAPLIDATSGIATHPIGTAGEVDPHVWHDVTRTIQMVNTIADALVPVFPEYKDQIRSNSAAYSARLTALDTELASMAETLPPGARVLVTSHDTFGYFAERYGFTVVGTVFGASTAGADPSATAVASLVDAVRASGTKAIFVENMSNPALVERVAAEAGVIVAPALYTDALGAAGSPGATYIDMMRANMTTIVTALRGAA